MLLVLAASVAQLAIHAVGRTPGEIITYLEKRLSGHPQLEAGGRPVLGALRALLAEDEDHGLRLPFVVPPLPANPMRPPAPEAIATNDPRVIRVGPQRTITRISVAAQMARDGSIIEIDPGDYVADVAVWDFAELTIRGLGDRVRLIARGADAEGKAIWVIRRGKVLIENVEFVGARVADHNGAGIRLESGNLVVRRCRFRANENGILTAAEPNTTLEVEESEFGYNGAGDGLTHGIYVGEIASFKLRASYVHHANVGHLVKSRARVNRIEYNRLSDEEGGRASYELEFPNGGFAEVVGNVIQQGSGTQNSNIVSYGAERQVWQRNELHLAYNTVVNDHPGGGSFLAVAPGTQRVLSRNNLWVGPGRLEASEVMDAAGDRRVEWEVFERPSRQDFRLNAEGRTALAQEPPAPTPPSLTPAFEYRHPAGVASLKGAPTVPGALQSAPP